MEKLSRREFIGTAVAATGIIGAGGLVGDKLWNPTEPATAAFTIDPSIKSPTHKVKLGKSGLEVSLVGIGTGTIGVNHQSNQTRLGQEAFTRLVRHAFDTRIIFFHLPSHYAPTPYSAKPL